MMTIPTISLGYATTDICGLLYARMQTIREKIDISGCDVKLLLTLKDFYNFINHPRVKENIYNIDIVKSSGLVVTKIEGEYLGIKVHGSFYVEHSGFVLEKEEFNQLGTISLNREIFPINFGGELNGSQD